MNEIVKKIQISLPSTKYYAEIEIRRAGQVPPRVGDDVAVRARIILPANDEGGLIEELHFGERCRLFNKVLDYLWGLDDKEKKGRYFEREFRATKWREAEARAEAWALGEVEKLVNALRERRRVLLAADED